MAVLLVEVPRAALGCCGLTERVSLHKRESHTQCWTQGFPVSSGGL